MSEEENTNEERVPMTDQDAGTMVDTMVSAQRQAVREIGSGIDGGIFFEELAPELREAVRRAGQKARARKADELQGALRRRYQAELKRVGGRSASYDAKAQLRAKFRSLGLTDFEAV